MSDEFGILSQQLAAPCVRSLRLTRAQTQTRAVVKLNPQPERAPRSQAETARGVSNCATFAHFPPQFRANLSVGAQTTMIIIIIFELELLSPIWAHLGSFVSGESDHFYDEPDG